MEITGDGHGGHTRARTLDPLIKSQLLYQLSYVPMARLPVERLIAGFVGRLQAVFLLFFLSGLKKKKNLVFERVIYG
ncbi:hypothetical protein AA103587_0441 [Gluconobacter kanchanaburiensis NBRC 103587]|nr:hypothetical protein AA103587_0441 [Gluconobacter kanchanaburiensis NBRC 103587]